MGRTPKPLTIYVSPTIAHWPEWDALMKQGHDIIVEPEALDGLYIGPECWYMDEQHKKYLDLAISSARARRYPTKGKGK